MESLYCWPIITGEEASSTAMVDSMFAKFKPQLEQDPKRIHEKVKSCKVPGCQSQQCEHARNTKIEVCPVSGKPQNFVRPVSVKPQNFVSGSNIPCNSNDHQIIPDPDDLTSRRNHLPFGTPRPACYQKKTARMSLTGAYSSPHFNAARPTIFECGFCKRNAERKEFYSTHVLKDSHGNIVCPILREHACEICGATGNRAHTKSYCPMAKRDDPNALPIALALKLSPHDSSGKLRKFYRA